MFHIKIMNVDFKWRHSSLFIWHRIGTFVLTTFIPTSFFSNNICSKNICSNNIHSSKFSIPTSLHSSMFDDISATAYFPTNLVETNLFKCHLSKWHLFQYYYYMGQFTFHLVIIEDFAPRIRTCGNS
jgi:hypothetical protein